MYKENMKTLKIIKMFEDVKTPYKHTKSDSGFDLYAYSFKKRYKIVDDVEVEDSYNLKNNTIAILNPLDRILIGTGIKATYAEGYEIQIRSRSGLTLKNGLVVANGIGTIDNQFKSELCVILINLSHSKQMVEIGDRIAQMVVVPIELPEIEFVDSFDTEDRGGGFGSSGI